MPFATTVAEVYRHKNNMYVFGTLGRSEPMAPGAGQLPALSDAGFQTLNVSAIRGAIETSVWWFESGLAHFGTPDVINQDMLDSLTGAIIGVPPYPNFVDATQSAGPGAMNEITAAGILVFTNDDVEAMYNALTQAMQSSTKYWDIGSITRLGGVMTVTLDETNQPYTALWDGVWAEALTALGLAV